MPQTKTKPVDGAVFGTLALVCALCCIFFLTKPLAIAAIVLGVLALLRQQPILGVVPIVIGVLWGFIVK